MRFMWEHCQQYRSLAHHGLKGFGRFVRECREGNPGWWLCAE